MEHPRNNAHRGREEDDLVIGHPKGDSLRLA